MGHIDLNLLISLNVLLQERSVTAAARRLGISPSAMSRTLARLRKATKDPLLVQAGRRLVATPYAEQLSARVHQLARETQAVLQPPSSALELKALERRFNIRASEVFIDTFGARFVSRIGQEAPNVQVVFVPKPDKDPEPLRNGAIDLEVGVVGTTAPEIRKRLLFRDRFIGVCRADSHLLKSPVTAESFAACRHVIVSRRGVAWGPVDDALDAIGLTRRVVAIVPSHPEALWIARDTDLVALVPRICLGDGPSDRAAMLGLKGFELPVGTPEIAVSAIWHPRIEMDAAHRWLRDLLFDLCRRGGS